MNKKLSELFDLPEDDLISDDGAQEEPISLVDATETLSTVEKIERSLPQIKDLDGSDRDLDEYASLAKEAYTALLDLGMQVDSRFSAEIFNSAGTMLGHAISAKTAKINRKLKTVQLQIQQAELERKIKAQDAKQPVEQIPLGEAKIFDRSEILRQILEQNKNSGQKDK